MPKHLLLKMAFDAGYEAVAEKCRQRLLAEAQALQYALYDGRQDKTGYPQNL